MLPWSFWPNNGLDKSRCFYPFSSFFLCKSFSFSASKIDGRSSGRTMELWCFPRFVVHRFLHDNGFTSVRDRDSAGWSPMCYAAVNGNPFLKLAMEWEMCGVLVVVSFFFFKGSIFVGQWSIRIQHLLRSLLLAPRNITCWLRTEDFFVCEKIEFEDVPDVPGFSRIFWTGLGVVWELFSSRLDGPLWINVSHQPAKGRISWLELLLANQNHQVCLVGHRIEG